MLEDVCEQLPTLERYVIITHDRSNTCKEVNEARRDLFTRKGIDIEGIPPWLMPCVCTQSDVHTKLGIAGARHWCHPIPSHVQVNGAGCRVPVKFRNHYL